jgi:5,10-methylenetetrahydromethanopterin reductase
MKMEFGIGIGGAPHFLDPTSSLKFIELVKTADRYGIRALGTQDTAFVGGDAFVRATLMATASNRVHVGLRPTNPLTREPQVMASFLASIDGLTEGRAFVDIASGDSSVRNIGLRPSTRARIEEYVTCIRELMASGVSNYMGRPQAVQWAKDARRSRIPISICAEGPKMLHLAGRIGDGVVSGTGLTQKSIADTYDRVAQGAKEAGREPGDVEVWFVARSSLDDDSQRAIDKVRSSVASILHHAMGSGLDGKSVPDELRVAVQTYVNDYVLADHTMNEGANPKRMDALGLTDFAMERWALAGNATDWIRRITQIGEAGAERLWLTFGKGDLAQQIRNLEIFGSEILPHFTT